jgi:hypothetical protein
VTEPDSLLVHPFDLGEARRPLVGQERAALERQRMFADLEDLPERVAVHCEHRHSGVDAGPQGRLAFVSHGSPPVVGVSYPGGGAGGRP